MPARVLLVGLDGATFDLIGPWAAAGHLPHLARLMDRGAWGPLRSTVPPATFPAWTSLVTGVWPGEHGIYDFTRRVPGTYRLELVNATYRRRPSVWRLLSQAGRRVAAVGFPASYPPEPLAGLLIAGFDSPLATAIDRSFANPPAVYDDIRRAVGPYPLTGFQELRIGPGWHARALDCLLSTAARRAEIGVYLLSREAWDCLAIHFGETDTAAHHFWAWHDPHSPRHDPAGVERWGDALLRVYQAVDAALGRLLAAAGDGALVLIVSDHGSGGTGQHVLHLNRWLAQHGWLRFAPPRAAARATVAVRRLALALPAGVQQRLLRGPLRGVAARLEAGRRLGGLEWAATRAFSEEVNTLPALWLNVRGREPAGIVAPGAEYERLRAEIVDRLLAWRSPATGAPVIARAWRREELYHGPTVDDAPDIILEPALDDAYAYTVLPSGGRPGDPLRRLAPAERLGARGGSLNGSHRPDGVLIASGPGARPGARPAAAQIVDVAPTLLRCLGVPLPAVLDGRVLAEALAPDAVPPPDEQSPAGTEAWPGARPYTARESAEVERRLRALGYRP